jgi:hypothetical protein
MLAAMARIEISTGVATTTPTIKSNPFLGGHATDHSRRLVNEKDPVNKDLYARCIAFWIDDATCHVIVSADVLAFPRTMNQNIRAQIRKISGLANDADEACSGLPISRSEFNCVACAERLGCRWGFHPAVSMVTHWRAIRGSLPKLSKTSR